MAQTAAEQMAAPGFREHYLQFSQSLMFGVRIGHPGTTAYARKMLHDIIDAEEGPGLENILNAVFGIFDTVVAGHDRKEQVR